ncbi:MAG: BON domain-containing protein [Chloroflexota bacterium]|nr:MAG: BON domain-containing protein [Chloroflexota bacterium]
MADRYERYRDWRRFDEDEDFENRPGALDRKWGYGDRLRPGYNRRQGTGRQGGSEFDYPDEYNAPDYWVYQEEWMRPGPFTGVGPRGYRRSDERIREEINDRLTQHAEIDPSEVEIEVAEGEVTLKGVVEDRRMKRMIEANVEMIPGVIDVHNQLALRKPVTGRDRRKEASEENPFPGGPTPSGPAGY